MLVRAKKSEIEDLVELTHLEAVEPSPAKRISRDKKFVYVFNVTLI